MRAHLDPWIFIGSQLSPELSSTKSAAGKQQQNYFYLIYNFFQRFLQVRLQLLPNTGTIINWETSSHVKCPRRVGLDVQNRQVNGSRQTCRQKSFLFFLRCPILQRQLS